MKTALLLALAWAASAQTPRLFYSKSFPGSVPAYTEITIESDGAAVYKEAADDELPIKFRLLPAEAGQVFELARKLDHFTRPLEAGLKVANMGKKTYRYEEGAKRNEVSYNFSTDANAQALQEWFERISETAQHHANLQRTAKYDKLGVMKVLLQIEAARDNKRLVSPEVFLPLLDRIIKNESYLHMARARAAGLAEWIRAPKPAE